MREIGQLFKEVRLRKGMTQEEVAALSGVRGRKVSVSTISKIESGDVDNMTLETVFSIALALKVRAELLRLCAKRLVIRNAHLKDQHEMAS